jgi:tricorn protease
VDADRNAPAAGAGRVDVTLRMYLEPKAEFKQIFDEGWRNQRDYLYVPNMHGTDWGEDKQMYGKLLPYINHRADLNYLLDMMGAEISVGHSFVRGGDMPEVPAGVPGGLLGADFTIDGGRYKIARIYDTESWNPGGRLHHRRAPAEVRRLLQQHGRRSLSVHESRGGHLGTEGDDHQRDGRVGRRHDAVHVP